MIFSQKYRFSEKKNLLVKVKFLSSLIALKYGIVMLGPKFLSTENEGIKNPDLLLTVGSGYVI